MEVHGSEGRRIDRLVLWARLRYLLAAVVLSAGVVVSAFISAEVGRAARRGAEARFPNVAAASLSCLKTAVEPTVEALGAVTTACAGAGDLTRQGFEQRAKPLAAGLRGVQALYWVPRVADKDRPDFEAATRAEGFTDFQIAERQNAGPLASAGPRGEYFPLVRPAQGGAGRTAWGYDLASEPDVAEAIAEAIETGRTVATGRVALYEGQRHPWRVLLLRPVYGTAPAAASAGPQGESPRGLAVAVLSVSDLVRDTLKALGQVDLNVWLFDDSTAGKPQLLYAGSSHDPANAVASPGAQVPLPEGDLRFADTFDVAGRTWRVVCTPGAGWAAAGSRWPPRAVFWGGLLVSGLVALQLALSAAATVRGRIAEVGLADARNRINRLTTTDALTGLIARGPAMETLRTELDLARPGKSPVSVVLFDVDHFRMANDVKGHAYGDHVLLEVAKTLQGEAAPRQTVCRYGSDTFMIVMPETAAREAVAAAEQVRKRVARRGILADAGSTTISLSAGVGAAWPGEGVQVQDLLRRADQALAAAKDAGGNCTKTSDDVPAGCRNILTQSREAAQLCGEVARRVGQAKDAFVDSMASVIGELDARDVHTRDHARKVARYAVGIARTMGLSDEETALIRRAAILHDIGNVGVPESVLRKEGVLTSEERRIMEQHVQIGVAILEHTGLLEGEIPLVRQHHERWDGSGYPDGIGETAIPLGARILAVADAFDAITSDRAYRKARDLCDAVQILIEESRRQFDPDVVDALVRQVRLRGSDLEVSDTAVCEPSHAGAQ